MPEFREQFLSSKLAATLKELRAQRCTNESLNSQGQRASWQGLELIDRDGENLDVNHLEDLRGRWPRKWERCWWRWARNTNYENTNFSKNLECQDDNVPIPNNVKVTNTNDLQPQHKMNDTICPVKKGSTFATIFSSNWRRNSHS